MSEWIDRALDFLMDSKPGCLLLLGTFVALCILLVGSCVADNKRDKREYEEFMSECMKDHKKYECTALWRQGKREHTTSVVPIPVVIPTR